MALHMQDIQTCMIVYWMAEVKGYIHAVCIEVGKIAAHGLDNDFCSDVQDEAFLELDSNVQ